MYCLGPVTMNNVIEKISSHAAQTATDRSDIDIAVYLDAQAYSANPLLDLEIGLFFEQRLSRNVDVVVMQKVSPAMQHHILASSERLFERDPLQRARMELISFKEYVDSMHYLRRRMQACHG